MTDEEVIIFTMVVYILVWGITKLFIEGSDK